MLSRFDDECGAYHDFADGLDIELSFISLREGLGVIDAPRAREVVVVEDLDYETVLPQVQSLSDRHGALVGPAGVSEKDVVMAARVRERLSLPGWPVDLVRQFKDKVVMKDAIRGGGLRPPGFRALTTEDSASGPSSLSPEDLVRELGLPLVLKPRAEGASRGISVHHMVDSLAAQMRRVDHGKYEVEQFVEGPIVHVDGILRDGRVLFVCASVYVGTCLEYAHGAVLGSTLLNPGPMRDRATAFALRCVDILGLTHGPFHLELIVTEEGEPVFLEVGIRPGGADVPFLLRDVSGIDLFGEAFRCTLGLPALGNPADFGPALGR